MASTFSSLSKKLTELNSRASIGGGSVAVGPVGPSDARTRARRALDEGLGVPPSAGDPGYVAPPEPPIIPPPTPMPDPDPSSLGSIAARRRSIQAQLARRGRLSTILTQGQPEPLGG